MNYSGRYPGLADHIATGAQDGTPRRICILTQDIFGPVRNAGIGTAYRHAAEFLAKCGHDVTIIFTQGERSQQGRWEEWTRYYKALGVTLVGAQRLPLAVQSPSGAMRWSVQGYHELKRQGPFDIVHSSECGGSPYIPLLAKFSSGEFTDTIFCIKTSSPALWSRQGNFENLSISTGAIIASMERTCVELADLVIAPSQHMLDWMVQHGYTLPPNVSVHPNISPGQARLEVAAFEGTRRTIREICFFGRLEARKGIKMFKEALTLLADEIRARDIAVTFLGKTVEGFDFEALLEEVREGVTQKAQAITTFNAEQVNEYLAEPGRLAVIPSFLDNSPFTVYESLANGHTFLASDIGGIPELVEARDRERVLFAPRPSALAAKLADALTNGCEPARLSFDPRESQDVWRAFHAAPDERLRMPPARAGVAASPASGPRETLALSLDDEDTVHIDVLHEIARGTTPRDVWLHAAALEFDPVVVAAIAQKVAQGRADCVSHGTVVPQQGAGSAFHPAGKSGGWNIFDEVHVVPHNLFIRHEALGTIVDAILAEKVVENVSIEELAFVAGTRFGIYPVFTQHQITMPREGYRFHRRREVDNRILTIADAMLPPDQSYNFRRCAEVIDEYQSIQAIRPVLERLRQNLRFLRQAERAGTRNARSPDAHLS